LNIVKYHKISSRLIHSLAEGRWRWLVERGPVPDRTAPGLWGL